MAHTDGRRRSRDLRPRGPPHPAALAAVATGDRERAQTRLAAIAKLRCPFPAPADTQAAPSLTAFVDGLVPRRAARAVDQRATSAETRASSSWRQGHARAGT